MFGEQDFILLNCSINEQILEKFLNMHKTV